MPKSIQRTGIVPRGGRLRTVTMPDIFQGAEKKTRPASITILKSLPEVYETFRDFSRWPIFIKHLAGVTRLSPTTYRWRLTSSNGTESNWETEIIEELPGRMFAWRTRAGSPFEQTGAATFEEAPGGRGTIVGLKVAYRTTLGKLTGAAEKLTGAIGKFEEGGDPDTEAAMNLHRLKSFLETGEVPTTKGQPSGREEQQGEQNESTVLAG